VQSLEWKVESEEKTYASHSSHPNDLLLVFAVKPMTAAAAAELIELEPIRRVLFVLGRHVIALLTLGALQNYVISWHKSSVVSGQLSVVSSDLF
jgi:hypothetical protein